MDTSTAIDSFKALGLSTTETGNTVKKQTLGQDQFLKLLTTQLTHQDPMKPMENGEFLGQMAQFSTVSGIQELQASFKDFVGSMSSSQALQASGLVGRTVSAPSQEGLLGAVGNLSGDFELSSSSPSVKIKIINPKTGETVKDMELQDQASGTIPFSWDGEDNNGTRANPGVYKVEVSTLVDGKNTVLPTNIKSQVSSVTMANGGTGLMVNLNGLDPVKFSQIKQIL